MCVGKHGRKRVNQEVFDIETRKVRLDEIKPVLVKYRRSLTFFQHFPHDQTKKYVGTMCHHY